MNKGWKQITALVFSLVLATSVIAGTVAATPQQTKKEIQDISIHQQINSGQSPVSGLQNQNNIQEEESETQTLQEEEPETQTYLLQLEPHSTPEGADRDSLIEYMKEHSEETQEEVLERLDGVEGVKPVNSFWLVNIIVVELDRNQIEPEQLTEVDGIRAVTKSRMYYALDSHRTNQEFNKNRIKSPSTTWGINFVNARITWNNFNTKGQNTKVAVLDTGVNPSHQDIQNNLKGFEEFDKYGHKLGSNPHDTGNHGTHTSGTVVGGSVSGKHIGVAPKANLLHGLVLPGGSGTDSQILGGMQWAIQKNADVMSMSFGSKPTCSNQGTLISRAYTRAIRNSKRLGTLAVVSSGNTANGCIASPGSNYEALTVGAINKSKGVWNSSNGRKINESKIKSSYNKFPPSWPNKYVKPDVVAPGVHIFSSVNNHNSQLCSKWTCKTKNGELYAYINGTSMAAPHVAGVAALVISASRGKPPVSQVRTAIEKSGWKPRNCKPSCNPRKGNDTRYGAGIVNAYVATNTMKSLGIEGKVTDLGGNPITDAEIEVKTGTSKTDQQGKYGLSLFSGKYRVTANAPGYKPKTKTVNVGSGYTQLDFKLKKGNTITQCRNIWRPGEYELAQNIKTSKTPCIKIHSSDVVLDGRGNKIVGGSIEASTHSSPYTNITIKNIELSKFSGHGIVFKNVDDSRIHSTHIHDSKSGSGIVFRKSDNNTVGSLWDPSKGVKIKGNQVGGLGIIYGSNNSIYHTTFKNNGLGIKGGSKNVIQKNTLKNTLTAIHIWSGSNNNTVKRNRIVDITKHGILVTGSKKNKIRQNIVKNPIGIYGKGIVARNTQGTKIVKNEVNRTDQGIYVKSPRTGKNYMVGNRVINNSKGIVLRQSTGTAQKPAYNLLGNKLEKNGRGLILKNSNHNKVVRNQLFKNEIGVKLNNSDKNNFKTNVIKNGSTGLQLNNSDKNVFSPSLSKNNRSISLHKSNRSKFTPKISKTKYGIVIRKSKHNSFVVDVTDGKVDYDYDTGLYSENNTALFWKEAPSGCSITASPCNPKKIKLVGPGVTVDAYAAIKNPPSPPKGKNVVHPYITVIGKDSKWKQPNPGMDLNISYADKNVSNTYNVKENTLSLWEYKTDLYTLKSDWYEYNYYTLNTKVDYVKTSYVNFAYWYSSSKLLVLMGDEKP